MPPYDENNWVPPLTEADCKDLQQKAEKELKRDKALKKAEEEKEAEVRHHMWE